MKEFMFYIRNEKAAKAALTTDKHLEFVKKCEVYIGKLKKENRLVAAQPIVREGVIITRDKNTWVERSIANDPEVQVGYYHILANDLNEAISMAKENPEFEYVPSASIEVRPIEMKEAETGFIYPKSKD